MSYRCQLCQDPVPSGKKLLRHQVYRPDGTIAREVSVCKDCSDCLARGQTLDLVRRLRGPKIERPAALATMPTQQPQDKAPAARPVFGSK